MKRWLNYEGRAARQRRIRKKLSGTKEKPRLNVFRSINHIYVQLIDDQTGKTLLSLSTLSSTVKDKVQKNGGNVKGAQILGLALAETCKKEGVTNIIFDRAGYAYHGRVKALAEAARKGGLKF